MILTERGYQRRRRREEEVEHLYRKIDEMSARVEKLAHRVEILSQMVSEQPKKENADAETETRK